MMEIHTFLAEGGDLSGPFRGFGELFRRLGESQNSAGADPMAEFVK